MSIEVGEETLRAANGKITQILKSKVRGSQRVIGKNKHANNGGYIPVSAEYGDREVFVIILEKGVTIP